MTRGTGVGALLLAAAITACFSAYAPSALVARVSCTRAAEPAGPDTAFVVIRDFAFHPAALTVPAGTTVIWVNCESTTTPGHTTTSTAWQSPIIAPSDNYVTTPSVGTHPYHCTPHPFMQGTVTVTAPQLLVIARRYRPGVVPYAWRNRLVK